METLTVVGFLLLPFSLGFWWGVFTLFLVAYLAVMLGLLLMVLVSKMTEKRVRRRAPAAPKPYRFGP